MTKKNSTVFVALVISFLAMIIFSYPQITHAADPTPNYTVDYAPTTIPTFPTMTQTKVTDEKSLVDALGQTDITNQEIVLQNDITLTKSASVLSGANGNKVLNLNGHLLTGTSAANLLVPNTSTIDNFKLTNGRINAGRNTTAIGIDTEGTETTSSSGFILVDYRKKINFVVDTIDYKANNSGNAAARGGFFKGIASNVFVTGTTSVDSGTYNFRIGNITFLNATFNGNVTDQGNPSDYARSSGGNNITFVGYSTASNYRSTILGIGVIPSQMNGDRRMYVDKTSKVTLNNLTTAGTNTAYSNNIGNFSTITVEGSLIANAYQTSLRTTASQDLGNSTVYDNAAGTYNGQANINVQPGATFSAKSTNPSNGYGVMYMYSTDLNANNPKDFNMIYNGSQPFFYAYANRQANNLRFYNMNIAVWNKNKLGAGSYDQFWSNVSYFEVLKFSRGLYPTILAPSNQVGLNTIKIDDYSRISNDIFLPVVILDAAYQNGLSNTSNTLSGTTDYMIPTKDASGKLVPTTNYTGDPVINGTITVKIGTDTYTTTTDSTGKWSIDTIKTSPSYKGGTVGTIQVQTTDARNSLPLEFTIVDKIPPVATPKLIKQVQGTTLTDPKLGLTTYSDDTTDTANLSVSFKNTAQELKQMTDTAGVYSIPIEVKDEAGNATTVDAPLVVYPSGESVTNAYIVGNNLSVNYLTWNNATAAEKRQLLINAGLKAYTISGNTVTDVTSDTTTFIVTIPDQTWQPDQTYDIASNIGTYRKTLKVTLESRQTTMNIKQVYSGTNNPIYSDYKQKIKVPDNIVETVTVGSNLSDLLATLQNQQKFTLNYPGYQTIKLSDYTILQNGQPITTTTVPDGEFDIIFNYTGELTVAAPNVDFGEISLGENQTTLSDDSQDLVAITNTILNTQWNLKAFLSKEITSGSDRFNGQLIYRTSTKDVGLNGSSQTIQQKTYTGTPEPYEVVTLDDQDTGQLVLDQYYGNYSKGYSGTITWSLEDTVSAEAAK